MFRRCLLFRVETPAALASMKATLEGRISKLTDDVIRPVDGFGMLPRSTYTIPMVILLGNHSAGKSTYINSVLGLNEQDTGVAPTDDGFTVIMAGKVNLDESGPTALSNAANGFEELKKFGSNFENHFRLKIRKLPEGAKLPEGMMIVDTPGMIDTPAAEGSTYSGKSVEAQKRGYDFLEVTKWFAQRSDSILLMFDPSNPGTTGETLQVLTHSLTGQEHKFKIALNKSDVFEKVTDYARTYGTLAWNLSKVIEQQKDIPPIFSTYTMTKENYTGAVPREEMERARKELTRTTLSAPLYRLDNLLTEMEEAAKRITVAATVTRKLSSKYKRKRFVTMLGIGATLFGVPAGIATVMMPVEMASMLFALIVSAGTIGTTGFVLTRQLEEYERQLLAQIDHVYDECFPSVEMSYDEKQRWNFVKRVIMTRAEKQGILALPTTSSWNVDKINKMLKSDVGDLHVKIRDYKQKAIESSGL